MKVRVRNPRVSVPKVVAKPLKPALEQMPSWLISGESPILFGGLWEKAKRRDVFLLGNESYRRMDQRDR